MKRISLLLVIILVIIAAMFAVAAPALASGSCSYNPQHGWHIVGGGQLNDHWFATEAECLAALATPTNTTTEPPTSTATETPTSTETPVITDTPTESPTATETPVITDTPTATPTPSLTPEPTESPVVTAVVNYLRGNGCNKAWKMIQTVKYKDVGYRFFESHNWCKSWLSTHKGIDYSAYKVMHP